MRITSILGTSALFSFLLAGIPSGAQEATTPASTSAEDSAQAATSANPSETVSAHSKIRIVRLSEVKGEVQLDRDSGRGFEAPMTNLPIVEGNKLRTENGIAEVEFEDNSTVRVAQNSLVEFPRLELLPGGAKASTIHVLQGMVYVNLMKTKGNEFTVLFGKQTVNLPPDTHIRLQLTGGQADLAVLHGDALVEAPTGVSTVGKNKTMTFNMAGESQPLIAKNVTELPLDAWDHNAVQYHNNFANASSYGNSPYSYGINDMNYYGSFINASGCGGSMWRPYFTSASWSPYGSGAWAYYPSAGYSWVSPYPWGWTPYHSGSWDYCQGVGWGWRPGGQWYGLANNSLVSQQNSLVSSSSGTGLRPHPPLRPPAATQASLVPVNLKAMPASTLGDKNTFVFRSNSAGFGVPRGSLGKLNSFSNQAASHGTARVSVFEGGGGGAAARGGSAASFGGAASSRSYSGPVQSSASSSMSHASGGYSGGGGMSHASGGASGSGGHR
jgi:hypothetical protein